MSDKYQNSALMNRPDEKAPLSGAKLYADQIELLKDRTDILSGKDRVLLKMYLENGISMGKLARLAGVSESTIARRINKLSKRLTQGKYIKCLRNRSKLTSTELFIARDHFIEGLSKKKIAEKRKITLYQIKKVLKKIDKIINKTDRNGG